MSVQLLCLPFKLSPKRIYKEHREIVATTSLKFPFPCGNIIITASHGKPKLLGNEFTHPRGAETPRSPWENEDIPEKVSQQLQSLGFGLVWFGLVWFDFILNANKELSYSPVSPVSDRILLKLSHERVP